MGQPTDRAAKLVESMDSKSLSWQEWFVNEFFKAAEKGALYAETRDFFTFPVKAAPEPMDAHMTALAPEIKSILGEWEITLVPSVDSNDVICRSMSIAVRYPAFYNVTMKRCKQNIQ